MFLVSKWLNYLDHLFLMLMDVDEYEYEKNWPIPEFWSFTKQILPYFVYWARYTVSFLIKHIW